MKRPRIQRDEIASLLFGLSDESLEFRNRWRSLGMGAIWLLLSGLTMLFFVFLATDNLSRVAIIGMSFIKYVPLISVVYALAKSKAAKYLDDLFELGNEDLASDFIEEVAFGYGNEKITINEGKISEKEERSPIILIGGPGMIQVNLDSVALLEKVDGEPEIIYPRGEPWKLGRFERIREIGKNDEVGKREYAIINLRDQFVRGLSVRSRTKDGIPLEAQDIKVMFSILRKPQSSEQESDPYHFDERAVLSLVYNQVIITPPPNTPSGVTFPWDTTVIPLVTSELENLITSRNLSEILASISQKEMDVINQNEETNVMMRIEMTGEQTAVSNTPSAARPPNFESRSKITSQFFSPEFREKAGALGVAIHWIDIGTWQLPSSTIILDKLKDAWNLMRENAKRRNTVNRSTKQHEFKAVVELVTNVVISNYSKTPSSNYSYNVPSSSRKYSEKDLDELARLMEDNPEIATSPQLMRQFSQSSSSKKNSAHSTALEILKAFRKELIVAKELIQKENRSSIDKQAEIARIDKALRDINYHIYHFVKSY
ncbi:MAG TPA: hypothetical protein PK414_06705 [Anaerolineales bacterium]|nr:hypothetical protein [Anaerolineales bacterium]HNC09305.1 hypothetical protein [Anaerolineales bacterium]